MKIVDDYSNHYISLPDNVKPDSGNFIFQRIAAAAKFEYHCIEAIATVPYCPKGVEKDRWANLREVFPYEWRSWYVVAREVDEVFKRVLKGKKAGPLSIPLNTNK